MSVEFRSSQTKDHLMRAFAGESQARNRYTFAAGLAKQQQLHVLEEIFNYTANQEKEHAEIFYNFLKELSGENIPVDGSYPVDNYDDAVSLLSAAQHNEYEEHDVVYKTFGDVANQEGFLNIGTAFHQIAKIEKTHGDRFGRYAEMLSKGQLFKGTSETKWLCLNCGHIHTGEEAPRTCPVCKHDQGYFVRIEDAPFGG